MDFKDTNWNLNSGPLEKEDQWPEISIKMNCTVHWNSSVLKPRNLKTVGRLQVDGVGTIWFIGKVLNNCVWVGLVTILHFQVKPHLNQGDHILVDSWYRLDSGLFNATEFEILWPLSKRKLKKMSLALSRMGFEVSTFEPPTTESPMTLGGTL